MVGIKFSDSVIPFPDGPGHFIRLCFKGNGIVQGHVLFFQRDDPNVIDMANGNVTTPEVLMEGDRRSSADKILVTYTKITGVKIKKEADAKAEKGNGTPPPVRQPPLET